MNDFHQDELTPVTGYERDECPPAYRHQIESLQNSCFSPEFAQLGEMGTGKSKILLDNICILYEHGRIRCALIVAPNSVYRNWALNEIPEHVPNRIKETMYIYLHKRDKYDTLINLLDHDGLIFLLFNVEAFSVKQDLLTILTAFMGLVPTLMVVDESPTIKGRNSKRSHNIIQLGRAAEYRRIATGLLAPNSPMDVFSQFQFLRSGCLGTNSPTAFRARYCNILEQKDPATGHVRDKLIGARNEKELREKISSMSYRVTKEDCLDLPEKVYEFSYSDLDDDTKHHYKIMKEQAIFELDNENYDQPFFIRSANRVSMVMRLQRITCGHMKDQEGREIRFSHKRIKDTIELMSRIDGSAIIWATYVRDIEDLTTAIQQEFGVGSVRHYYGSTSKYERDKATELLQSKKIRWLVSNPSTGRFGNTWTAASTAIYYSNSYDLEHRLQSEDRIHRIGQHDPCLYIDVASPGTINLPIIRALRLKMDMASEVMGDKFKKEWLI